MVRHKHTFSIDSSQSKYDAGKNSGNIDALILFAYTKNLIQQSLTSLHPCNYHEVQFDRRDKKVRL